MNRYTAAGVLADMRNGRRVVVLSETQHLARLAFAEVADGEQVRRANGYERITTEDGKGWVAFGSSRGNGFRGLSADVLVFDAHWPGPDVLANAAPIVAATGGDVIRP